MPDTTAIKAQGQVTLYDLTDNYTVVLSNESVGIEANYTQNMTKTFTVSVYRGQELIYAYVPTDTARNTPYISGSTTSTSGATEGICTITVTFPYTSASGGSPLVGSGFIPLEVYAYTGAKTGTIGDNTDSAYTGISISKAISYNIASEGDPSTIYELNVDNLQIVYTPYADAPWAPTALHISGTAATGTNPFGTNNTGTITLTSFTGTTIASAQNLPYTYNLTSSAASYRGITVTWVDSLGNYRDSQSIPILTEQEPIWKVEIDPGPNGTTFKNTSIATTLTANIWRGGEQIVPYDGTDADSTSTITEALAQYDLELVWKVNGTTITSTSSSSDIYINDNQLIIKPNAVNSKAVVDTLLQDIPAQI